MIYYTRSYLYKDTTEALRFLVIVNTDLNMELKENEADLHETLNRHYRL